MSLPSDALMVGNLLRIAAQDLDGAVRLATAGNRNAPYLCQQAAEKIVRAVAHTEGAQVGRDHRIDVAIEAIPVANPLRPALAALAELTPYATTYRYPRPAGRIAPMPAPARMHLLIERTGAALDMAARVFGVDLAAPDTVPAADASAVRDAARAPRPLGEGDSAP